MFKSKVLMINFPERLIHWLIWISLYLKDFTIASPTFTLSYVKDGSDAFLKKFFFFLLLYVLCTNINYTSDPIKFD